MWKRIGLISCVVLMVSYWYQNVYHKNLSRSIVKHEFDFIIVGGGTAGCVVASRLSEDPSVSVLLLEAGPADTEYQISIPAAVAGLQGTELDWKYVTEPQKHTMYGMKQNCSNWPRGKVLGGSSQLNYLMYVRGNKEDYDSWSRLGAQGWSYEEVLPYFKKLENDPIHDDLQYHGKNGPISVELPRDGLDDIGQAVIDALKENGIPHNPDYNGKTQIGSSFTYLNTKKGARFGAAQAYIHPNLERPNLVVLTEAHVTKIIFDGKRASGVLFRMKNDTERTVLATKEVIVSGGTIGSAQLLMLSGIGRPQDLEPLGIPVVSPLEVGQNLQDHLIIGHPRIPSKIDCMITMEKVGSLSTFLQWLVWGTGYLSTTTMKVTAFTKMDPDLPWPDFQICLLPSGIKSVFKNFNYHDVAANYLTEIQNSFSLLAFMLHPKSIGYIKLKSSNPFDHPIIQPNYFEAKEDFEAAIQILKFLGKIIQSPVLENFTGDAEPLNGELPYTDNYYQFVARNIGVLTSYHPIGTCKMGSIDDPTTVVDPKLQVKGVTNLRVVDASVMPHLTSGNTHVPVLMIGEKASDFIKQHWNLK